MRIDRRQKQVIGIKVDKDYKLKIEEEAKSQDMTTSEYIRELIDSDMTNRAISKNQKHLFQINEIIISNILDKKLEKYDQIIKAMFIKQELMIELIKETSFANKDYSKFIEEFMTSYTGNEILTILS